MRRQIEKLLNLFAVFFVALKKRLKGKEKTFVYIALGDSTVEGVGASHPSKSFAALVYLSIKQIQKNVEYHNFGKSGARIKDVIDKQIEKAIHLSPDLIIISVGANDVRNRTKVKKFEGDMSFLLSELRRKTKAHIVVNTIPDLTIAPRIPLLAKPYLRFVINRFNKVTKDCVSTVNGICVDLYSQSRQFKGYKGLISEDGFHPSDMGYALWSYSILSAIINVIV